MKDYFDRVVNGYDDYSLIVYDYRGNDKISNKTAAAAEVKTSAKIKYEMAAKMLKPGTTAIVKNSLKIMCGALGSSNIDINLENLSLDSLGLSLYKITRCHDKVQYSNSYKQKMQAWEDSAT